MSMWISAYLVANEPIVQWCSIRLANLSLQHGNSEMAAFAFVQHGFLCIARLQRFEEGYEYGELALKLADRCESLEMRGKIYFMFGMCISHWKEPCEPFHGILSRKAYAFSVEGGDWTYAVYAAIQITSNLTIAGVQCDVITAEAHKYLEFLKDKAVVGLNSFLLPSGICTLLNLQGKTVSRDDFSCQYLDEKVFLNTLCSTLPTIQAWFFAQKLRSLYYYRSFATASVAIARTESIASALPAQFLTTDGYFYICLTLAAANYLAADADNREYYLGLFDRHEQQMKNWADHCPENYLHKYYLIKGERARLEHGSLDEVLAWYDKAIQSAKQCELPKQCGSWL